MIYGNVLRSPEICYKCVAHSHTLSPLSLSLSRCQCHTHMKMFYKQFSSWFLCVFVHSFNYLAIKYDEPRSRSLSLSLTLFLSLLFSRGVTRCRRLVVPIPALSALYGHVLWRPRVLVASLPTSTPHIGILCGINHIYIFIVSWQFGFFWLTEVLASKYSGHL